MGYLPAHVLHHQVLPVPVHVSWTPQLLPLQLPVLQDPPEGPLEWKGLFLLPLGGLWAKDAIASCVFVRSREAFLEPSEDPGTPQRLPGQKVLQPCQPYEANMWGREREHLCEKQSLSSVNLPQEPTGLYT